MFDIFKTLADTVTYNIFQITKETHLAEAVHFFIEDTSKIFALITSLMLIIGFFRSWISAEKVRYWLEGKPKIIGYFLAVILGAITPFCSCSSIPLFIAFLSSGIPLGVTMAFLITSPMVNEVAAVLFGEAIGWHFTLFYVAVGMVTGIVGGALIDALKLEKWVEPFVFNIQKMEKDLVDIKQTLKDRLQNAWRETLDVLKRVWVYILIGVGIGASIHGFVPQEWFIEYAGAHNLFAVPLAVIIAVPLYSNVTGVVPIAEVLINKGLPIGTTLAFIMSTVAISLPELVILRKVLKIKMLAFFVMYMAFAFITVGYSFNLIYR